MLDTTTVVNNPLREGLSETRIVQPCVMVIFGATGDLTQRKLLPALYSLAADQPPLPGGFTVVGVARRPWTTDEFRKYMLDGIQKHARQTLTPSLWEAFSQGIFYEQVEFETQDGYDRLAQRLKEIAMRVKDEFGGDLRSALAGPLAKVRKTLKSFPGIADPGADRILLFAGIAPLAAVPSNCIHVLIRILQGPEGENYSASYREAQRAIAADVPDTFDARMRAYLLLKTHGQQTCKRTNPKCKECPVQSKCVFFLKS